MGDYNIVPALSIAFIIVSWIYTNFKVFEINPISAIDNILESMSNAIIITNNEFKIKYTNDTFNSYGLMRKDMVNQSLITLANKFGGITAEQFDDIQHLEQANRKSEMMTINIGKNTLHLLMTVSPTYNSQNIKIGYVFVLINLTETIQNRNQLKEYSAQLEQSNKELERFAYIASHDMKAPLRNIISFLGLIERKLKKHEDKDIHEFIDFASSNARYMHSLVQDILEFSKISKVETKLDFVDLNIIVTNVKNNLSEYLLEKNAAINIEPLPTIKVNNIQIYQLFQNLIENGIKYNESKIPTVNITAKANDEN
ncbi:MAG: PAS domain-containing protein [Saprospiraceae bacterium]|nr:PAS domain-containing protein [Saprospiraceae bacterium]